MPCASRVSSFPISTNCGHIKPTRERISNLLGQADVRLITIALAASHLTQIFQILALAPFGFLQRQGECHWPFNKEIGTVEFLIKMHDNFKQVMAEINISGIFQAFGFQFDASQGPDDILFNKEDLTEITGFKILALLTFPGENLSRRRREIMFR
jgi:hypothetical protein